MSLYNKSSCAENLMMMMHQTAWMLLLLLGIYTSVCYGRVEQSSVKLSRNGWYKCTLNTEYYSVSATGETKSEPDMANSGKFSWTRRSNESPWKRATALSSNIKSNEVLSLGDVASSYPTECAQFYLPLCYSGICDDPAETTIPVFLKRIPATVLGSKKSIWLIQGGPGVSSIKSTLKSANLLVC